MGITSVHAGGAAVRSRRVEAAGVDTHVLEAGQGDEAVVCVHGNPDSGDLWLPLLERSDELGRVVAPDLPGFGRSERPGRFRVTVDLLDRWLPALLDELGVRRVSLVLHDWGGYALAAAARRPESIRAVAAVNVVPLDGTWRWHFLARLLWRRRVVGELSMPLFGGPALRLLSARASGDGRPMPAAAISRFTRYLDRGMKRAVLQLYRSGDPDRLAQAGARLERVGCPKLLLWGDGDRYIGIDDGRRFARSLPNTRFEPVRGGGHWPMVEVPQVWDRIAAFLTRPHDA